MLRTLAAPVHVLTFRKFAGGGKPCSGFGVRAMYFIANTVALKVVELRRRHIHEGK